MSAVRKLNLNKFDYSKVQSRIKFELEKREWNYAKLAKLTSLSAEHIRRLCHGNLANPTIKTLESVAEAFNIDLFDFLGSEDAVTTIDEKNIPIYKLLTLNKIIDKNENSEHITCLVKGSENSFAVKVDDSLEEILVSSNAMFVDVGDIIIFDKKYNVKKIRNRSIIVYKDNKNVFLGEVMGINEESEVFVSELSSAIRHTKVSVIKHQDIIALMSGIQFK